MTHDEYLRQDPENAEQNPQGAWHIPIVHLEDALDVFHWGTQNYQYQIYKDGYAKLCVAASIELVLNYRTPEGSPIRRTFVGACNFPLTSIEPIPDWNATAKSMCIKNAASDAGRWLGRGINNEAIPDRSPSEKTAVKQKADSKIMEQFLKAQEAGDKATIVLLSNIYDIESNGQC